MKSQKPPPFKKVSTLKKQNSYKTRKTSPFMTERPVLGLMEPVVVYGNNGVEEKVLARVDSGATSSSIDLNVAAKLELGPITRSKVVKSASGIGKRPIVQAKIKIGDTVIEDEFSLADRSHMTYPILIGQNILKEGKFLIDPLKKMEQE